MRFCYGAKRFVLVLVIALLSGLGNVAAQTCNGIPVAGSVSADVANVCPGATVQLTLSGQSADNGINIQWQSSADNITWQNIGSATGSAYTYNVPNSFTYIYFRAAVTCTQSAQTAYSNAQEITPVLIANYVSLPFMEDFEGDWIHICADGQLPQPVQFGLAWQNTPATGNSSWRKEDNGASAAWSQPDYGAYSITGGAGSSHSARFHSTYGTSGVLDLYLNCNTSLLTKKLSFNYINTDGTDSLEVLLSTDGGVSFTRLYGAYTTTGWAARSVLFSTASATAILRFKGVADNADTDMGLDNVEVKEVVTCSGTPSIGTAVTSDNNVCNGAVFKLGLTSATGTVEGIGYQWQSSADGTSGWNNIAGATDSFYTASENTTTYFRVVVACTIGGGQVISNSVKVATALAPMHGTYTINSAAATGGTNFKSFNDAYSQLHCAGVDGPVIFNVAQGGSTYNEQLIIETVIGMSATNTITFNGNGNKIHYSHGLNNNTEFAVIKLRGASYFTFDKLVIDATAPDPANPVMNFGVHLLKNADNNTFTHCRIVSDTLTTASSYGVVISGADDGLFSNVSAYCDNNTFDKDTVIGGYMAIAQQSDFNGICDNNKFTNNLIASFNFKGLSLYGASNTLIEGNTFACNLRLPTSEFISIHLTGGCSNTSISKNKFTNPYDGKHAGNYLNYFGIMDGPDSDWPNTGGVISNNLLYKIAMAESVTGIMIGSNTLVYHNTIDIDFSSSQPYNSLSAIRMLQGSADAVISNNLISIKNSSTSITGYAIYSFLDNIHADYNNYFLSGSGTNNVAQLNNTDYNTLADWQSGSGVDNNSVSIDPVYENVSSIDLWPTAVNLDNRGTPLGITTDITGALRSTVKPDIGAYEFAACVPLHGIYTIDAKAAAGTARTFLSFNDAYNALRCGIDSAVIFNVKTGSGVYNEQLNMQSIDGASALNTVTFNGNGETIHFSSADELHKAVIQLAGTKHVIFDSLVIDALPPVELHAERWGYGVQLYNDADNNTFRACTILTDSIADHFNFDSRRAYMGISLKANTDNDSLGADHNLFENNNISGGYTGVEISGRTLADSFIDNNVTGFNSFGMLLEGQWQSFNYCDSLLVQGNKVWNSKTGLTAIHVSFANNSVITKNIVHDITSDYIIGIMVQNLNDNTSTATYVTNNLIYNLGRDSTAADPPFVIAGIQSVTPGTTFILHNTIALKNTSAWDGTVVEGFENSYIPDNGVAMKIIFENNLVSITGNGKGEGHAVSLYPWDPQYAGMYKLDYNNYYIDSSAKNFTGMIMSSDFSFISTIRPLADWRSKTLQDSNTVHIDPVFTNVAAADYKPSNFYMDNLGMPAGIKTDILDVARDSIHPDMGAYEFKACPGNFANFILNNSQVCIGEPVMFDAIDTAFNFETIDTWVWDFGNGATSSLHSPSITFNAAGTYNVKLTTSLQGGCTDDTAKTITVSDCYKELFIPNTFTPNGDGMNDVLKVYGNGVKQLTFMVFNQWGQKLFESQNITSGWDGTQNGKPQPSGVYMYICKVIMSDGKTVIKKGDVNLVR